MLKLLREENLFEPVRTLAPASRFSALAPEPFCWRPMFSILIRRALGLMDLTVERNAYGRQIDSRIARLDLESRPFEAVFIRAPIIRRTGSGVRVLLKYQDAPVLVEQGRHMAATFHPELTSDARVHERFVAKVRADRGANSGGRG